MRYGIFPSIMRGLASIALDAGGAGNIGHAAVLVGDEGGEFLGRKKFRLGAELAEFVDHGGRFEPGDDFGAQPRDDRRRRAGGCEDAGP